MYSGAMSEIAPVPWRVITHTLMLVLNLPSPFPSISLTYGFPAGNVCIISICRIFSTQESKFLTKPKPNSDNLGFGLIRHIQHDKLEKYIVHVDLSRIDCPDDNLRSLRANKYELITFALRTDALLHISWRGMCIIRCDFQCICNDFSKKNC